jgi:TonB family protein
MKSEQCTRCALVILVFILIPAYARCSEEPREIRKSAANQMAKQFSGLGIHKLYVPDFCGGSSHPNPRGAFFAATFSKLLSHNAKKFVIESRVEAHRFLLQGSLTDCDLTRPEVLSKFSSKFGVDSLLSADRSVNKDSYTMDFILTDVSGKELLRFHYSEPNRAETEGLFPAIAAPDGWPYYFAALDGVSELRVVETPNPAAVSRRNRLQEFLISAVVGTDGKLSDIRVVRGRPAAEMDSAIERIKSWRFVPFKGPDGSAVSVRVPIGFYY